ncbi:MAG: S49 family peptidase [Leptospirales bacterium]|jgi:signal peptide peptidase SppA
MFLLRLLILPLRIPLYLYYALRNLARRGDLLFHAVPDRFTMLRPGGVLAYFAPRHETHFVEYLALLRVFAESDVLSTLVYTVPDLEASWSEVEQMGRALEKIDAAGKQLIAYSEGGNLKTLYLMSFADRRYAAPHANFVLNYPATEGYFLKSTIARFGVTVETHHAGKFKAEGFEMFTRTGYSPAARKNLKELLGDFRARIDARFALCGEVGDKLTRLARKQILAESGDIRETGFFDDSVGAAVFEDWIRSCLIDGQAADPQTAPNVIPPDEISDEVLHHFAPARSETATEAGAGTKGEASAKIESPDSAAAREAGATEDLRQILKREAKARRRTTDEQALYKRHWRKRFPLLRLRGLPSLALVTMDGPISMGRPGEPPKGYGIAALGFRDLIKDLGDGREEAVFLYINSPGGGADASELLFDSIYRLSRVKPVLAVVGSVAASGGYYLACAANRIYASPFSIVGSIGVIRIRPNVAGLYKKLGVKRESIFRDPTRDLFSEAGPLSPASRRLMKATMQSTYDLFLRRVAQGRNQSPRDVSRHAEGRVFSGERFEAASMIDGPFSMLEAIEDYRRRSGYSAEQQFHMNYYPEVRADLRSLAGLSGGLSGQAFASGPGAALALAAAVVSPKERRFLADLQGLVDARQPLAYAPWREVLRDV